MNVMEEQKSLEAARCVIYLFLKIGGGLKETRRGGKKERSKL